MYTGATFPTTSVDSVFSPSISPANFLVGPTLSIDYTYATGQTTPIVFLMEPFGRFSTDFPSVYTMQEYTGTAPNPLVYSELGNQNFVGGHL